MGADAGHAIQTTCKKLGFACSSAKHSAEVFTPLVTLQKKNLTKDQIKTMQKFARSTEKNQKRGRKHAVFVESSRGFKTLGGDNCAENCFTHAKNALRRQNWLGRSTAGCAARNFLACQWQASHGELSQLLAAFALFKHYNLDRIGVNPFDIFDQEKPWDIL